MRPRKLETRTILTFKVEDVGVNYEGPLNVEINYEGLLNFSEGEIINITPNSRIPKGNYVVLEGAIHEQLTFHSEENTDRLDRFYKLIKLE